MAIDYDSDSKGPTLDEQRREIVDRCLQTLMQENPQYYYEPAADVARALHEVIRRPGFLNKDENEAALPLAVRDIEVLLAYK